MATVDVIVSDQITELIVEDRTSERLLHKESDSSGISVTEMTHRRRSRESGDLSAEEIISRELAGAHMAMRQMSSEASERAAAEGGGSPPGLLIPPQPQSIVEGETLRLTCRITGTNIPDVQF